MFTSHLTQALLLSCFLCGISNAEAWWRKKGQDTTMDGVLEVDTTYGPVIGSLRTSARGTIYYSFQGIPYAKPPVDKLRLVVPQTPDPWTTALNLTGNSDIRCPQLTGTTSGDLVGQEDCLYMNIYSPAKLENNMPVLVWIYGGGFITGSGRMTEYGPEKWLDQGIIVVTINYRLYLLGFLSLGIPEVPGNQGLLDQLMALKMVQSDIHKFGGDPQQVTLAGQSAGSSSALYHVQSPRSKGLFKRVIAESGSNFSPSLHSITAEEAVGFGKESCDAVGCIIGGNSPHARLDCLQGHSLDGLVRLTSVIGINIKPNEDKAYADEPFMPMSPMDALKSGSYNQDVDVLIGTNLNDGLILTTPLYTTPSLYFLYRHLWGVIAPGILFHLPVGDSNFDSTHKANQLADFYLGGTKNIVPENFDKITDMFTDAFVTYAVECFAKHAQTTQKVFHYKYVHQGQYGLNTDANLPKLGVNHADELYLMWEPIYDKEHPLNPEDQAMSDLIVPAWANFIKTGDPGIAEWKAREVNVGEKYFVLNTTDSHMERSDEYQKRMQFWESIFPC